MKALLVKTRDEIAHWLPNTDQDKELEDYVMDDFLRLGTKAIL